MRLLPLAMLLSSAFGAWSCNQGGGTQSPKKPIAAPSAAPLPGSPAPATPAKSPTASTGPVTPNTTTEKPPSSAPVVVSTETPSPQGQTPNPLPDDTHVPPAADARNGTYKLVSSEQRYVAGSTIYPQQFTAPDNYGWQVTVANGKLNVVKQGIGGFTREGEIFSATSCGDQPDAFEILIPSVYSDPMPVDGGVSGYRTTCPEFFFSRPDSTTYWINQFGQGELALTFTFQFDGYYVAQIFDFKLAP